MTKAHFAPGVQGHLIAPLRHKLGVSTPQQDKDKDPAKAAFDPPMVEAVRKFQRETSGLTETGFIDEATYKKLLPGQEWPDLFERALMFTSFLEGHGFFETIIGNPPRDPAGATAGIIGFTVKSGSLLEVLFKLKQADIDAAFAANGITSTDDKNNFKKLLALRAATKKQNGEIERLKAAKTIFGDGPKVKPPWEEFLRQLLKSEEGMKAQKAVAREMYFDGKDHSEEVAAANHLDSDFGRVLAYSSCVQSGGMTIDPPFSVGNTERFRRLGCVIVRDTQFRRNRPAYESRHIQLAKGRGFKFIDLERWGFENPDTAPAPVVRLLPLALSVSPQLQAMKRLEAAAVAEHVVEASVSPPKLADAWHPEFEVQREGRAEALRSLTQADELPISCLILGGTKAGTSFLSADGGTLRLAVTKEETLHWNASPDLNLSFCPIMRHGLVILYVPSGVRPKDSFALRLRRVIEKVNGTAPVIVGWFGISQFPGPTGPNCAETFFKEVKKAMGTGTLETLIAASPEAVIQAWGNACHSAYKGDATFEPLWRKATKVKVKDQPGEEIRSACAAIDPSGNYWRAVATPTGNVFMERATS